MLYMDYNLYYDYYDSQCQYIKKVITVDQIWDVLPKLKCSQVLPVMF